MVQVESGAWELLTTDDYTWTVKQEDLVRYAAAALDFNKIHYDAGAARGSGFDAPIAHGMLNLGVVMTRLADAVGVQDIRSSHTRFSAPAYVGAELKLSFDVADPAGLIATIINDQGQTILSTRIELGAPSPICRCDALPQGELVADRWFVVEQGPATRFAATLDARSASFHRKDAAKAEGFEAIPVLPTFGFVLPGWGFFPELKGNEGATAPDAVRDCQDWAETRQAVVHVGQSFQYSSLLLVGALVRSRSTVVNRFSKQRGSRVLRFTDVCSVLTNFKGDHVLTSAMTLLHIEGK